MRAAGARCGSADGAGACCGCWCVLTVLVRADGAGALRVLVVLTVLVRADGVVGVLTVLVRC